MPARKSPKIERIHCNKCRGSTDHRLVSEIEGDQGSEKWGAQARAADRAAILAGRKLAQYDAGKRVPVTMSAISDAVRWTEEILKEIDPRWPDRA